MLSGAESQRLRLHFSTTQMIPARDLDDFGWAVMHGDLAKLEQMVSQAVARHRERSGDHEAARAAVVVCSGVYTWVSSAADTVPKFRDQYTFRGIAGGSFAGREARPV